MLDAGCWMLDAGCIQMVSRFPRDDLVWFYRSMDFPADHGDHSHFLSASSALSAGRLSSPDEKLSCDPEPRSGERYIAWGVSPRLWICRSSGAPPPVSTYFRTRQWADPAS